MNENEEKKLECLKLALEYAKYDKENNHSDFGVINTAKRFFEFMTR